MFNQTFAIAAAIIICAGTAVAETAEFTIKDDPALDKLVADVRADFLAERTQNQPGFTRLDVTLLLPAEDGTWRRGSYGGDTLHYPASAVKLAYMAAAAHWERVNNKPVGFLEPHVGPMIRHSDNVATGRVVDAITETTNVTDAGTTASYEQWKSARLYASDFLSSRGLLENQVVHVKTYPTNSGDVPAGFEQRMWKDTGRNAMQTNANASLLLEIIKGKLESRSTTYMRGLLTHDRLGSDSVLGFGVPPGAIYENKTGRAFDTLADFAYIKMPGNDKEMILAVLSNAFIDSETSQPTPYGVSVLGGFAEAIIERAGLDVGAPPKVKRDNSDASYFTTSGDWATSTSAQEKFGDNYLTASGASDTTSATWNLAVPEDGLYEICIRYPQGADLAADAPFTVTHADGATTLRVDQRTKGGRWVKLGDYNIKAAKGQVSLSTPIANKTQSIAADAVKATKWPDGTGQISVADDRVTSAAIVEQD